MKTLKSLTCCNMGFLTISDLLLIAECFPFLDEIDISSNNTDGRPISGIGVKALSLMSLTCIDLSDSCISDELLCSIAEEGPPLRKLLLQCCYRNSFSYTGIFCLLSKCKLVQHLYLQGALFLEDEHIIELSAFLGNLMSISLSYCRMLTNLSLFALTRNCPLLSEITMEDTSIGGNAVDDSLMDLVVNSQMKSLRLPRNSKLRDDDIKIFASICPNLQRLDLNSCSGIYQGIVEVLKRCPKIRHLSFGYNLGVKLHGMNFQVPALEVLNFSFSGIDDEELFIISKSCCRLLHLDVVNCSEITAKGVKHLVENCKQLREINLISCHNVAANVVDWMVFSRSSLRRIWSPPSFCLSESCESQRERYLRRGCVVT